ncbi:hypothetical protein N431DRAFT_216148 [Stipitochalara longipes BDJ]|nr:hypothetical protein N431DRAFT_216148 [Stipitochalara longipes BDJ]
MRRAGQGCSSLTRKASLAVLFGCCSRCYWAASPPGTDSPSTHLLCRWKSNSTACYAMLCFCLPLLLLLLPLLLLRCLSLPYSLSPVLPSRSPCGERLHGRRKGGWILRVWDTKRAGWRLACLLRCQPAKTGKRPSCRPSTPQGGGRY